jgi:hypothetical protein
MSVNLSPLDWARHGWQMVPLTQMSPAVTDTVGDLT